MYTSMYVCVSIYIYKNLCLGKVLELMVERAHSETVNNIFFLVLYFI